MLSSRMPPIWRLCLGFLIAPGVAAVAKSCYEPDFNGLSVFIDRLLISIPLFCLFAYSAAFVLGIPALVLLAGRVRATVLNCMLAGGFIAVMPFLIFGLFAVVTQADFGTHVGLDDGRLTRGDYLELAEFVGQVAFFGIIGGLTFWLAAVPDFGTPMRRNS